MSFSKSLGTRGLSCLLSLVFLFEVTSTQASEPRLVNGVDVSPLVEFFSDFVYTMNQDVFVYHWFSHGGVAPWSTSTTAADPNAVDYVRSAAPGYWRSQGDDGGHNMYGRGLYAAVDPVTSASFGLMTWGLVQIKIEKGFRFVNLARDGRNSLPMKVQNVLRELECPTFWNDRVGAFGMLLGVKEGASQKCLSALEQVFDRDLAIDAFSYGYSGSHFEGCDSPERNSAFVITSNRKMTSSNVRYFTSETRDESDLRRKIQTLFFKVAQPTYAGPMTAQAAGAQPPGFLWKDLEGQELDPGTSSWARENFYACKPEPQYE